MPEANQLGYFLNENVFPNGVTPQVEAAFACELMRATGKTNAEALQNLEEAIRKEEQSAKKTWYPTSGVLYED